MTEGKKYLVGSGRIRRRGWLTIDADERVEPDIVSTLPPVPEECRGAAVFELIHVFEHFYKWEAEGLLVEFFDKETPADYLQA